MKKLVTLITTLSALIITTNAFASRLTCPPSTGIQALHIDSTEKVDRNDPKYNNLYAGTTQYTSMTDNSIWNVIVIVEANTSTATPRAENALKTISGLKENTETSSGKQLCVYHVNTAYRAVVAAVLK